MPWLCLCENMLFRTCSLSMSLPGFSHWEKASHNVTPLIGGGIVDMMQCTVRSSLIGWYLAHMIWEIHAQCSQLQTFYQRCQWVSVLWWRPICIKYVGEITSCLVFFILHINKSCGDTTFCSVYDLCSASQDHPQLSQILCFPNIVTTI